MAETVYTRETDYGAIEVRADGMLGAAARLSRLDMTNPNSVADNLIGAAQFLPVYGGTVTAAASLIRGLFGGAGIDVASVRHEEILGEFADVKNQIDALGNQLRNSMDGVKNAISQQADGVKRYMTQLSGDQQEAYRYIAMEADQIAAESAEQLNEIAANARDDIEQTYNSAFEYADTVIGDAMQSSVSQYAAMQDSMLSLLAEPIQRIAGQLSDAATETKNRLEYLRRLESYILTVRTFDIQEPIDAIERVLTK